MRMLPASLLAVLAFTVAGCDAYKHLGGPNDPHVWRDDITTTVEHPIRLDVNKAAHVVRAAGGKLNSGEAGRLGAFLAANGAPWSMDVRLRALTPDGEAALVETAEIVGRLGGQPDRILLASGGAAIEGGGDIVVDVRNVRASAVGCPDWRRSNLMDLPELNSSNFGCATADNLARMIADPRELSNGRPLDPANGAHAAGAVDRYRTDRVKALIEREGSGGAAGGGS